MYLSTIEGGECSFPAVNLVNTIFKSYCTVIIGHAFISFVLPWTSLLSFHFFLFLFFRGLVFFPFFISFFVLPWTSLLSFPYFFLSFSFLLLFSCYNSLLIWFLYAS